MKTALFIVLCLLLMAVAGVGGYFYGENAGLTQAQNIRSEFFQSRTQSGQPGDVTQGQRAGGNAARNTTNGIVKSVQGNTIEVTARDGSTVKVNVDSQTAIQRTVAGAIGDVKSGDTITVLSDQTGSTVTARTIQLRPAGQSGQ